MSTCSTYWNFCVTARIPRCPVRLSRPQLPVPPALHSQGRLHLDSPSKLFYMPKEPTPDGVGSFGCFELNDTNEMCLKAEDFL